MDDKKELAFRELVIAAEEVVKCIRTPMKDSIQAFLRLEDAIERAKEVL